jgi:2-polyprenyl-6-methoxyphenol hydroxylase-like FAD-dependent oxidoreductase
VANGGSPKSLSAETQKISTTCCIAGGGPAGMMLGFLLARAGVSVIVLEKHRDFFRDFRGDTIHPSTFEVIYELGLLDEFLKVPHQEMAKISGQVGDFQLQAVDFTHLPVHCKYVGLMPQWDFLNFVASQARRFQTFELKMEHEASELLREGNRVIGVSAKSPGGPVEVYADLVVAADGRSSDLRRDSKLEVEDFSAPIDVLWMRISKRPSDAVQTLGYYRYGAAFVMLNRDDYWQGGMVVAKGSIDKLKQEGLEALRQRMVKIVPFLHDRISELKDWDQIKLLSVQINRMKRWHLPGFLCIGDAAHAMSPIGGVGINLAVQDAVAAANILAIPLREGRANDETLARVQSRREPPTRWTQQMQITIQNFVFKTVIGRFDEKTRVPWFIRLFAMIPIFRRIPARVLGMGFRPEHVRTPELPSK